jgi:hypothetical protein
MAAQRTETLWVDIIVSIQISGTMQKGVKDTLNGGGYSCRAYQCTSTSIAVITQRSRVVTAETVT